MRLEVIRQRDDFTREVWEFSTFELTVVLNNYWLQTKETKRKKKWDTVEYYSRLDKRDSTIKHEGSVHLPDEVVYHVLEQIKNQVVFKKWSEYKQ